jgi:uncharacterized protein (DUF1697 family)
VAAAPVQIALLRGINVGGNKLVGMAALRELLAGNGYDDVRTYLQSGNVLLSSAAPPARLERDLEELIADGLGVDLQVFVRTRDELADVIERDPLRDVVDDPAKYLVSFLSAKPKAAVVRELAALDAEPERFVISGRELYAWHPGGIGRSALRNVLTEKKLGVSATGRNWKTVTKLLELADE